MGKKLPGCSDRRRNTRDGGRKAHIPGIQSPRSGKQCSSEKETSLLALPLERGIVCLSSSFNDGQGSKGLGFNYRSLKARIGSYFDQANDFTPVSVQSSNFKDPDRIIR